MKKYYQLNQLNQLNQINQFFDKSIGKCAIFLGRDHNLFTRELRNDFLNEIKKLSDTPVEILYDNNDAMCIKMYLDHSMEAASILTQIWDMFDFFAFIIADDEFISELNNNINFIMNKPLEVNVNRFKVPALCKYDLGNDFLIYHF